MKFRIGDKLKVINIKHCQSCNIGEIVKVVDVEEICKRYSCKTSEGLVFYFEESELEKLDFTKADLKDGDIVTYRNGERRLVNATDKEIVYIQNPNSLSFPFWKLRNDLTNKDGEKYDIVKVERATKYEMVFERNEEILDEAEKKYLADVIRPFKNEVQHIVKYDNPLHIEKEYLRIKLINNEEINFPDFEEGSMYKRMERDKKYTLEELGL